MNIREERLYPSWWLGLIGVVGLVEEAFHARGNVSEMCAGVRFRNGRRYWKREFGRALDNDADCCGARLGCDAKEERRGKGDGVSLLSSQDCGCALGVDEGIGLFNGRRESPEAFEAGGLVKCIQGREQLVGADWV